MMSDATSPSFDEKGKYLFFMASTDVGPVLASSMGAYNVPVDRAAYVIVLRNDLRSPLAHRSDELFVIGRVVQVARAGAVASRPPTADQVTAPSRLGCPRPVGRHLVFELLRHDAFPVEDQLAGRLRASMPEP